MNPGPNKLRTVFPLISVLSKLLQSPYGTKNKLGWGGAASFAPHPPAQPFVSSLGLAPAADIAVGRGEVVIPGSPRIGFGANRNDQECFGVHHRCNNDSEMVHVRRRNYALWFPCHFPPSPPLPHGSFSIHNFCNQSTFVCVCHTFTAQCLCRFVQQQEPT